MTGWAVRSPRLWLGWRGPLSVSVGGTVFAARESRVNPREGGSNARNRVTSMGRPAASESPSLAASTTVMVTDSRRCWRRCFQVPSRAPRRHVHTIGLDPWRLLWPPPLTQPRLPAPRRPLVDAYFDVDGTLVDTNLLGPTACSCSTRRGPSGRSCASGGPFGWSSHGLAGGPRPAAVQRALYANYRGISWDRMEVVGRDVRRHRRTRIFRGAQDLIDQCHKAGQQVVLTGSLNHVIQHLTEYLGADGPSPTGSSSGRRRHRQAHASGRG